MSNERDVFKGLLDSLNIHIDFVEAASRVANNLKLEVNLLKAQKKALEDELAELKGKTPEKVEA